MKNIFQISVGQSPDLVIHTEDGEQVLGHSLVLSLHSPLIADIISGIQKEGRKGITIKADAQKVRDVVEMNEKNECLKLSVDDDEVVNLLGIR